MEQEKAAKILLVRAVEEVLPEHIAPEMLLEAHLAAGNLSEGSPWIIRRAEFLVDHAVGGYSAVLQRIKAILPNAWLSIGVSVILGLVSNYLGPSEKILVLWNPIILLIAWNVLIYVILAVGLMVRRKFDSDTQPTETHIQAKYRSDLKAHEYRPGIIERFVLGPIWSRLLNLKTEAEEIRNRASEIGAVGRRFTTLWRPVAQPRLRLWLQRTLHLCAIGIAIGAILGMYMRGLVFKYEVIWRSTFVTDPATVEKILGYVFGPALILLGQNLPDTRGLLNSEGVPAAEYIHLYALTAILIIVIPRCLLAVNTNRMIGRTRKSVQLDFQAEYYVNLLEAANSVSPKEQEAKIRQTVADECRQICDRLAEFVCVRLYDSRITPRLWRFREDGGSLKELEDALSNECQAFKPEFESEVVNVEHDLDKRLAERVKRLLGNDGQVISLTNGGFTGRIGAASSPEATHIGDQVSSELATAVAATVSTSIAIVAGTLSGGFGSSLGVALLAGLVHSGPVAWVIGAVGALIATGATFALGWDKLRQSVKTVPIPAAVLKVALWNKRYEGLIADGRRKCEESVHESVAAQINQLSSIISDHLWNRLKPVLGERQRPRVGVVTS